MSKARQRAQAHYEMRRETIRLHHARQRYEQATSEIEHKSVRRRPCKMVAIALFLVAALVAADFAQARGGGGGRASVSRNAPASRPAPKPAPQKRTEPASNPSWFGWWWWHRGSQSNPDCKTSPTTPDRRKECEQ